MIGAFFKKALKFLQRFQESLIRRFAKKNNNAWGYLFGGPEKSRRNIGIILGALVVGILGNYLFQGGHLSSPKALLDHETAPGAKVQTRSSNMFNPDDLSRVERDAIQIKAQVDCNKIITNLRLRGTLTQSEKDDFNRACRHLFTEDVNSVIDKVIAGQLPPSQASKILQTVNNENAKIIRRALENPDIMEALRSEDGQDLAGRLGQFGNLEANEISDVVKIMKRTPPQFRGSLLDSVAAVSELNDPAARASMLRSLDAAKSDQDFKNVKDFANTLKQATPEEQVILAEAYEKAPNREAKQALLGLTKELMQLPPDDPVRNSMVKTVKRVSELPPEEQIKAYEDMKTLANAYRLEKDPEVKRAMAEAIVAASDTAAIASLADKIENMKEVEKVTPVAKDQKMALLAGDPTEEKRMSMVAELARLGDTQGVKRAISEPYDEETFAQTMADIENKKKSPFFSKRPGAEGEDAGSSSPQTAGDIKNQIDADKAKIDGLTQRQKKLEKDINNLAASGVPLTDHRLVGLYGELSGVNQEISDLEKRLAEARKALRGSLEELKNRTMAEFGAAGYQIPDFKLHLSEEEIRQGAPEDRLARIREVKEFWDTTSGYYKSQKIQKFKFNIVQNRGSAGDSLVDSMTETMGDKVWYVNNYGNGTQTGGDARAKFELSRLTTIPGVLRRVPDTGIPSKKASEYTLMFEFAVSVANRKTGRIEIPKGSIALCKVKNFDSDSTRLSAKCDKVDVGGRDDVDVDLVLGDAGGADGLPGMIKDSSNFELAAIFLTSFSAGVIDAFTNQFVTPYENASEKALRQFLLGGTGSGAAQVLENVAQRQVDKWAESNTYWISYDGALATVRQSD